eukprot:g3717.t1
MGNYLGWGEEEEQKEAWSDSDSGSEGDPDAGSLHVQDAAWEDSEEELNSEEKREAVLLEATVSSMTDDEIDNLIVLFEQSYGRTPSIVELENLIIELSNGNMDTEIDGGEQFSLVQLTAKELESLYKRQLRAAIDIHTKVAGRVPSGKFVRKIIGIQAPELGDPSFNAEDTPTMDWRIANARLRALLLLYQFKGCDKDSFDKVRRMIDAFYTKNLGRNIKEDEIDLFSRFIGATFEYDSDEEEGTSKISELLGAASTQDVDIQLGDVDEKEQQGFSATGEADVGRTDALRTSSTAEKSKKGTVNSYAKVTPVAASTLGGPMNIAKQSLNSDHATAVRGKGPVDVSKMLQ